MDGSIQGKRRLGVVGAAGVAGVVALTVGALVWPRAEGVRVPTGSLVDRSGGEVTLASRLAPVTLVHFWATWCAPCREEVPALLGWVEERAGDPHFALLMVAVADAPSDVASFWGALAEAATTGADVVAYDDWTVARAFGVEAVPESYLVADGRVVEVWTGPQDWTSPAIHQRIERVLRQRNRSR